MRRFIPLLIAVVVPSACLLSVVRAQEAHVHTDRKGAKVSECAIYGLAVEFRKGTAKIIDSVPLFDRAISSLTARLRSHPEPEPA